MKKFLPACFMLAVFSVFAQTNNSGWSHTYQQQKVFIENKGQFDGLNQQPNSKVLFGTDRMDKLILFTKSGITYRFEEVIKPGEEESAEREKEMREERRSGKMNAQREEEEHEHKLSFNRDWVHMDWVNANPNVQVVATDAVENYFNYGMGGSKSLEKVKGFKKVTYKNLYPNIDVVYEFHPQDGIEYSFILHPGADASQIRMKYSDVDKVEINNEGSIVLPTSVGNIIEHAPKTFYSGNKQSIIASRFDKKGNTVSFHLDNYNHNEEVTIDPWVQTPAFNTQWDCIWECDRDPSGNVYVIGGVMPLQLLKYNSAGTLQWTYSTPYDTTAWLGTMATDLTGNTYVTNGSLAAIIKVNTAGGLVWNNGNPGGIFTSTEFWSISFNCDYTKLVIGGTGGFLPPVPYIYQVDMANGNVTSSIQITGGQLFPTQEVRAITACYNGKYYFLTHDSIGYLMQNFSVCSDPADSRFYVDNDYTLSYKCENFRYNNTGIAAIKYYGGFIFVNRGNQLHKRDFATGAILQSVAIPGGGFPATLGSNYMENSGIDIDDCGNIYVGSKNQVVKFNQALVQQATYATTFNVYDVHINTNGDIIAAGSAGTANSGARQGAIQSIAGAACNAVVPSCCDASICQSGPFCANGAPVTLTSSTAGVWSGTGITNAVTGTFSPAVAGPGIHYIKNTIGCGTDSIAILVSPCTPLQACLTGSAVTVSGGVATYHWYQQVSAQDCSACIIGCLFPPGCAVNTLAWQEFATGTTVTPTTYPIQIVDAFGTVLTIANAAALNSCSACALTASASGTSTTCGNNNGTATVTPAGGTASTYAWSSGATTATASNLASGTYTVTVTGSGCTATASATVGSSTGITMSTSTTNAGCTTNGTATATTTAGTGPFNFAWNNGASGATISAAAGTYTVTVTGANSCTATASATIGSTGGITLSTSSTNETCNNQNGAASITVTAGTATGYAWSNGGTSTSISGVASGTYTVTVTGNGGCSATASISVGLTGGPTISASATNAGCNTNSGTATVTVTSGTPTGYIWSNGGTTTTITGLAVGTYTVTVSAAGGCSATASAVVSSSGGVAITASGTNTSCGNNNGSASVTVTSGTAQTYAWSNGGSSASLANLPSGTYNVTVTDAGGCTATASVVVNPSGNTPVSITAPITKICPGDSAEVCAPVGYASYLWNTGQTTQCIQAKLAGNYYVTVTDNGNCTALSNLIQINTYPQPPVSVSVNGDTLTAFNASSYQWILNGVPINNATNPVYVATQSGSYTVAITDTNGCTAVSNAIPLIVNSIKNLAKEDKIDVYPNPIDKGNLFIEVGKNVIGSRLELFDDNGRLVYQTTIKNLINEVPLVLAQGAYMLRISTPKHVFGQKLIKL